MEDINSKSKWRRRRDKEKITIVEAWKASDLSRKEFCALHKIANSGLNRLIKKFDKDYIPNNKDKNFTEIKVAPSSINHTPVMEIVLYNGVRIIFYHQVDTDYIRSLIS
jgi:hypothetical protein